MNIIDTLEEKTKSFQWYHFSLLKTGMLALGLFLAKIFPELLGLKWYWYVLIFLICIIPILFKMFVNTSNHG